MSDLQINDLIEVVGEIDTSGLEEGMEYRVTGFNTVNAGSTYILDPEIQAGNPIQKLQTLIDSYIAESGSELPYISIESD